MHTSLKQLWKLGNSLRTVRGGTTPIDASQHVQFLQRGTARPQSFLAASVDTL